MATVQPYIWCISFARERPITSRLFIFLEDSVCAGCWQDRIGLQKRPRSKQWWGQTRTALSFSLGVSKMPALAKITSYSSRPDRDKWQAFKCGLMSSRHSNKKTTSVLPRVEPQEIELVFGIAEKEHPKDILVYTPSRCDQRLIGAHLVWTIRNKSIIFGVRGQLFTSGYFPTSFLFVCFFFF